MRVQSIVVFAFAAALVLTGCSKAAQNASDTSSPAASASPADTGSPAASPADTGSPAASPADTSSAAASPAASSSESPTAQPTMPTPPPGLPKGCEQQYERVENGPEAELLVRTGAIDNFGFGWPEKFTPFSGESTPTHPWVCSARPGSAPGTDRNELGSGVPVNPDGSAVHPLEGYSGCDKRPDNLPQAIPLTMGTLPSPIHRVFLQVFLDDFQPVPLHSHFQVTLNGTRLPNFEDAINQLDQTGPVGKLLTIELLPEYWPILKAGTVNLLFDDPTTGMADGYAVNFARILVNPKPWRYSVTISCNVTDIATQKPIAKADCSAGGVTGTTDGAGHTGLRNVPAGLVSVSAGAVNYDSATQLLDLPAGQTGTANLQLKRRKEAVSDLKEKLKQNGSVAIYGIHFDTASAKLRPDSLASLNQVLALVKSDTSAHWVISGHTDNQGGAAYNLSLSQARAHSVVAWLTQHGVPADHLEAQGFGMTRPVADNATDSGRALNRRVEV